ncbi:ankyrin [Obba rivulosa]|uniref:Ankyrin n=1 Tax=Obba rivulosa TaxID=1052685 RepID=A0A8E2B457_9APHY|nr:ankyrin [Obba rivulosa]
MSIPVPSPEDYEEFLLSCRYGDVDDIRQFVDRFGGDALNAARDERGNTALHMVCANGHQDALDFLLPLVSPSLLCSQNDAQSTPLHWAALNQHLAIARTLVEFPEGPGVDLIDIKNTAGRTPLGEAENVGWDEGAKWFVEVMNLDESTGKEDAEADAAVDPSQDIEVEIQDAEGQVARMTLSSRAPEPLSRTADPS